MTEYEHTFRMHADPDAILDFLSDSRNLPKYLPVATRVEPEGAERVRMYGRMHGRDFDAAGFLRVDRRNHRVEWGTDGDDYTGWLQVRRLDGISEVTAHLAIEGPPPGIERAPDDAEVAEYLRQVLHSIQNHVEGLLHREIPHSKG